MSQSDDAANQNNALYFIQGDPIAAASTFIITSGTPGPTWDEKDTAGIGRSFSPGSIVQNSVTNVVYRCANATENNAIWRILVQEEI